MAFGTSSSEILLFNSDGEMLTNGMLREQHFASLGTLGLLPGIARGPSMHLRCASKPGRCNRDGGGRKVPLISQTPAHLAASLILLGLSENGNWRKFSGASVQKATAWAPFSAVLHQSTVKRCQRKLYLVNVAEPCVAPVQPVALSKVIQRSQPSLVCAAAAIK